MYERPYKYLGYGRQVIDGPLILVLGFTETDVGGHEHGGGVGRGLEHRCAAPVPSVLDAKRHWPRR